MCWIDSKFSGPFCWKNAVKITGGVLLNRAIPHMDHSFGKFSENFHDFLSKNPLFERGSPMETPPLYGPIQEVVAKSLHGCFWNAWERPVAEKWWIHGTWNRTILATYSISKPQPLFHLYTQLLSTCLLTYTISPLVKSFKTHCIIINLHEKIKQKSLHIWNSYASTTTHIINPPHFFP